jgi:Uncharacterized conserved protein
MKQIPDCVPDALTMILAAARAVSDEDFIHRKVLLKVMGELADEGDLGSSAADVYLECWEHACRALGVKDLYENDKARGDKIAIGILRTLAETYPEASDDDLRRAIRVSLAGAMLDFNILGRDDVQEQACFYYKTAPALDQTDDLVAAIRRAGTIMIVANRAGEIVMDKPLVEALADMGKTVYLTVGAKPVYFMATDKDAANAQLSERINIVDPGTAMYGLVQERASSEFQDLFEKADLVIVKGCIHYATMTRDRDLYFIMKGTDPGMTEKIGFPVNSGAIFHQPAHEE